MTNANATCSVCGKPFTLQFVYQVVATAQGRRHLCSEACRKQLVQASAPPPPGPSPIRMAVLNQKGGVGKTTTAVSLAAGLAEKGKRTLLVDADAQGSVGVSLGVRGQKSLHHVLLEGALPKEASVPVRDNLDVLTADETLAAAEIRLAQQPKRAGVMAQRLASFTGYQFVIVDCAPSLSLLNQNALCFVDWVLVPVSCDYLSLVGVKQVVKVIKHVNAQLGHPVEIGAVLPTLFDARARHAQEALKSLKDHFGERTLPPIRTCVKLKEAPVHKRTIFEYAPDSTGAKDYSVVIDWALGLKPLKEVRAASGVPAASASTSTATRATAPHPSPAAPPAPPALAPAPVALPPSPRPTAPAVDSVTSVTSPAWPMGEPN